MNRIATARTIFSTLRLLFVRDRSHASLLFLVLLSVGLTAGFAGLFPVLFSIGIDALNAPATGAASGLLYIQAFALGLIVVGVMEQIQWLSYGPLNLNLQKQLTLHVFLHALSIPYARLKNHTTHEVGRIIDRGLDAVRDILSNLTFFIIPAVLELAIAATVIAYMIDFWIAVVLLVALIVYGVLATVAARKIRNTTEIAINSGVAAWSFGLDGVANSELIQQANMVQGFADRLNAKLTTYNATWVATFRQRAFFGIFQALVFGTVVLFVLWRGALDAQVGAISIGQLVLLNAYIVRLLRPVETVARVYKDVQVSAGEAQLLADFLALPPPSVATLPLDFLDGSGFSLSFHNISVGFGDQDILKCLYFDVRKHERIFIVGPSGVGKSSLIKIISALRVSESGQYLINSLKVAEENAAALREHIAVVQQDCLLFDWSIRENVVFGIDAQASQVDAVLLSLGLAELEKRQAACGDATVGERGCRLSGGEKQRISLARAILRKPRLLLLDEPTAALDDLNRQKVIAAISAAAKCCTTVIVTHDMDLVGASDRVLFLENSVQYHFATHAKLISKVPAYRRFMKADRTAIA